MKDFKNYLQTQLSVIELKLQSINRDIENLLANEDIDLSSFGTKEELKKIYMSDIKPNIFTRIFGPTKQLLQTHMKNKELERLQGIKSKLEHQISQINQALVAITKQGIVGDICPNEEIIKFILEYASIHNINPKEILDYLVKLCKHSKQSEKVETKIEKNIASFFDTEDQIIEETKTSTITLLFEKLFMSILTEEEQNKYSLVINQILTQLKVEKNKVSEVETKPDLELRRKALIELQDYINGTVVIKTIDMQRFQELLDIAFIPKSTQENLLSQMKIKIKKEIEKEQRMKIIETMKRFLTEEEIEIVRKAELKEKTLTGPLKDLLSRAKKDVISMCKYLSLEDEVIDIHESLDILSDRIRVLNHVLLTIKEEPKEPNSLFYVTDKEGVPLFLRNLELYDLYEYNTFYNLLYKVATNAKGKILFTKDGIKFYSIGNKSYKIVYTESNATRTIIGIDSLNPLYSVQNNITSNIIDQIHEIEHYGTNPAFQEIHTTYENIILDELNIKDTGYTLSLKRKNS